MATKGNLSEIPVKHYVVTSSDVARYLSDQLGIRIDCDFSIWDNRAPWEKPANWHKCYVIMRAVFRPEDICIPTNQQDYADRCLAEFSANIQFREDFYKTIKQFMFPENMNQAHMLPPEKISRLAEMGIKGDALNELMRRPDLFYDPVNQRFGVYLRPERIIADMAKDPATNKDSGIISYAYIDGSSNSAESIRWGINVYQGSSVMGKLGSVGVTIDDVFGTARK